MLLKIYTFNKIQFFIYLLKTIIICLQWPIFFARELLKLGSVPSVTGMWGLNLNKKVQSSKVLFEEEFSEDSSDEEYKPNEEEQVELIHNYSVFIVSVHLSILSYFLCSYFHVIHHI